MTINPKIPLWSVPRIWPGKTVVCIGGGPSMTSIDMGYVEAVAKSDDVKVIAINDAYKLAPWADVLYACDSKWWDWHSGGIGFKGLKVCLRGTKDGAGYEGTWTADKWPELKSLAHNGVGGLELSDPRFVRTGRNSGYQAINLAAHFGATRILLLGYDMQSVVVPVPERIIENISKAIADEGEILQSAIMATVHAVKVDHWFGAHPDNNTEHPFEAMLKEFEILAAGLDRYGLEIINCTPGGALKSFPCVKLEEAI